VSLYLDTNIIVCLFRPEPLSGLVERWLRQSNEDIVISDFGAAEFSAVVSRDVRMGTIDAVWGRTVLGDFDSWRASGARVTGVTPRDIALAETIVHKFETKLGVPDALHLAIAANAGLPVATLDRRMIDAARMQGQPFIEPK
jgi:uncharacterized protein